MNQPSRIAIAAALVMGLYGGAAFAQSKGYNPSFYVMPGISAILPDSDYGMEGIGPGAHLRLGKPISQSWDIQAGLTGSQTNHNGFRYRQGLLGVDALYLFSRENFRPFVLIGAGAERDALKGNSFDESKTAPYVNAGLGFQYSFGEQWFTQVDLRHVYGRIKKSTFDSKHSDNNYLNIGLSYVFEKVPTPAPVAALAPPPPLAPIPAPLPVAAPRFERVTLSATELFAYDSAELRMPQPRLDEIANALQNNPQLDRIMITGHTDRLGSVRYNQGLSERRANAVKAYLVGKGVAATRLGTEGKGKSMPVVQCKETKKADLIKCLEPNRRVEVEQITFDRVVK